MCVWGHTLIRNTFGKMLSCCWLVVLIWYCPVLTSAGDKSSAIVTQPAEVWKSLPQLYQYDDFDECRRGNPDYVYCVVKTQLVEDATSELWTQISQYSRDPRHYRRDILELGICLDNCDDPDDDEPTHKDGSKTKLAEYCATNRVLQNYRINATSHLLNCVSDIDPDSSTGFAGVAFIVIVITIMTISIICTVIDSKKLRCKESLLVKSFSMSQNLRKLASLNSRSRQDLLFLDGVRVLTMMVILLCHASIPMIRIPLKNPERLEQQFDNFWFPIAMSGNTYTVQMFFVVGGIVLAVNFMDHIKAHPQFRFSYFWDRVINRLIRILPVYSVVVLFQASWYRSMKDGPIADRYKDHCRENWWTNLLFVNNYINAHEPCSQFTWYLGADFQLFLAGTFIMLAFWRFPKLTRAIVYCMIGFAFIVPAVMIYAYNLDATVMMINRHIIAEIRDLPYYLKVYVTFESNAGNYFFGMIMGIVYHHLISNKKSLETIKNFKSILSTSFCFFIAMNGLTVLLPRDHLEEPSALLAIYGSLLKSSWGILACCLALYLSFRPQSLCSSFLQHPIMLVASKLSYCIYVVQYSVVYGIYRNVTAPIMNNAFNSILFTSSILFVSFLLGFLLHVCVEVPFMTLLKGVLLETSGPRSSATSTDDQNNRKRKNVIETVPIATK